MREGKAARLFQLKDEGASYSASRPCNNFKVGHPDLK
jgi:hypothetical protein